MKLLTNPLFLRMALGLVAAAFAFLMGILIIRRMRRTLTAEEDALQESTSSSAEAFLLHTYHAVIQQLKQQKHELTALQQAERRRAKTTENISVAVLSNLSSGVLFFHNNGLVRQANQAAKNILGFASPAGLSAEEIFREARVHGHTGQTSVRGVAEAVRLTLHDGTPFRQLQTEYVTPAGEQRALDVTVSPIPATDGSLLGAACLISDLTPLVQIQRQQEVRGEMSAEMALALRSSLVTISGYAQQLAQNRDPDIARQLATDIAAEAAHLDRSIGGFLAGARTAQAGEEH